MTKLKALHYWAQNIYDKLNSGIATTIASLPLPAGAATSELQDVNRHIVKVDEATATTTYLGKADPGELTSAATWQIQRIDASAITADILFADGNLDYDNIWDNRAVLAYS